MELSSYMAGVKAGEAKGGGGYTLPPATTNTLGGVKIGDGISVTNDGTISASGGSSITPVIIEITEYMSAMFSAFYNNGEEYYETNISAEVQEQFDAAVEALNTNIATPAYFYDSGMPEHHLISNIQLGDLPFLTTWYHWAEPAHESNPPHMVIVSMGIQDGVFFGAIKKLDLVGSSNNPDEGEPQS